MHDDVPSHTDALPSPRFPAHGRVEYQVQGQCLVGDACGPFNLELVTQLQRLLPPLLLPLRAQAGWVHLCRFRQSALCSPEALQALEVLLAELRAARLAPQRTAFVLAPEVEGGSLMAPLFERSYSRAGLLLRCFEGEAEALAWLRG